MSANKTKPQTEVAVDALFSTLEGARRADAEGLVELLLATTGQPAVLWGSIVGFGTYHYRYASGREGDSALVGFSPRASEFVLYLSGVQFDDVAADADALFSRLGKHRRGKGCVYVKRLSDIDLSTLRQIVALSVTRLKQEYGD
ncbi:DUF1801 domain-containing protein [Devosia sp.]|jgi:hypothetical protein|uniref:DUF1801 domain-containing protein n=1 Tax=Devosia sp. TaxID=1871048 RepID=UPI0037BF1B4F